MSDSEKLIIRGRKYNLIFEIDLLRMFIKHHSRNKNTDLSWYEERILRVKYEFCLLKILNEAHPADYCDFVEAYGSTACDDLGSQTDTM